MAEIVNLRQARKRKQRSEKERAADAKRLAHGRSAAETKQTRLTRNLDDQRLEAHRRQPPGDGDQES